MTLDPTIEARVRAKRAAPLEQDVDALALLDEVERLRGVLEHLTLLHGAERALRGQVERERLAACKERDAALAACAEQTARAEKAEADYRRLLSERAEANQLAGRCAHQRDTALAACAEMRAAGRVAHEHACKMAEFHGPRCEEHERHDEAPADCLRCAADTAFGLAFADLRALLARPDLGAGPAALRIDASDGIPWGPYKQLPVEEAVATVEAAQEAALKEKP